jgi:hypothetical protein
MILFYTYNYTLLALQVLSASFGENVVALPNLDLNLCKSIFSNL